MEVYEYEQQSAIAQTLLREVASQREDGPIRSVFTKAASYCREVFMMFEYERKRANRLDKQIKRMQQQADHDKTTLSNWEKELEWKRNRIAQLESEVTRLNGLLAKRQRKAVEQ